MPMAGLIKEGGVISDADVIGFVFPLHYQKMPDIVVRFIRKLVVSKASYIFAVVTKGVGMVGGVLKETASILKEKSITLNYGAYVVMPSNFVTMFKAPGIERQKKIFKKADDVITAIIGDIINKRNHIEKEPLAFTRIITKAPVYRKMVMIDDRKFSSSEICKSCGICMKVCPVNINNIVISGGRPSWMGGCQGCLACMNYCPEASIYCGGTNDVKNRYHNPHISANDMADQKNEKENFQE
jgi:ferredoxin